MHEHTVGESPTIHTKYNSTVSFFLSVSTNYILLCEYVSIMFLNQFIVVDYMYFCIFMFLHVLLFSSSSLHRLFRFFASAQ